MSDDIFFPPSCYKHFQKHCYMKRTQAAIKTTSGGCKQERGFRFGEFVFAILQFSGALLEYCMAADAFLVFRHL